MGKISKLLVILFLALSSLMGVCAEEIDLISLFNSYEDDLKPVAASLAGAYLNKPKIELDGVVFTSSDGMIPKRVEFVSSDASTYLYSLDNPRSSGFFGFFSTLTSGFSPFVSMAKDLLLKRDFQKGEVVIDGWIDISGGENINPISLALGSDFSSVDVSAEGKISLSGERSISVEFSLSASGGVGRSIKLTFDSLKIDNRAIKTEPIMISFKAL